MHTWRYSCRQPRRVWGQRDTEVARQIVVVRTSRERLVAEVSNHERNAERVGCFCQFREKAHSRGCAPVRSHKRWRRGETVAWHDYVHPIAEGYAIACGREGGYRLIVALQCTGKQSPA